MEVTEQTLETPEPDQGQRSPPPPPIPKHQTVEQDPEVIDLSNLVSAVSPCPTYKDMATWTVEDDMPSPMDSSTPLDSPDLSQLRRFKQYAVDSSQVVMPLPPHPYLNSPTELTHPNSVDPNSVLPPSSSSTCFTVSSQLQSREARLYENVPPLPSKTGIESLGLIFHPPITSSHPSPHGSHCHGHPPEREISNSEFLSVSDFLNGGGGGGAGFGGPPSRSSWVDSGRESLSFDGESGNTPNNSNSNNSNSSRNVNIVGSGSGGPFFFQHSSSHDFSPSHHTPYPSKLRSNGDGRKSRRDRLVRQKHAIDENFSSYGFQPLTTGSGPSPTGTAGGGVNSMCSYLAVPSPRRTVLSSGIASSVVAVAASPISLHRHPNSQQLLLQENKKTRGLIPGSESPYSFGCATEERAGSKGHHHFGHTDSHLHVGGSFNEHGRIHRMARSPSRGHTSSSATSGSKYKVQHSSGCARYKPDNTFDYGELPSHQMFPKRHLLPTRQFSQPYGANIINTQAPLHQPNNHRSFPANLLSGVAPRSCSMGDLTSATGASPGSLNNGKSAQGGCSAVAEFPHHVTIPTTNAPSTQSSALASNGSHMVASLPLPPATSVTYEFNLAPVSGTLAPGWHLTAVQRGLATAVPLAAAVARRRLPRPRPIRPRFGFTDKNEARRAKCTIAVTALGLLAMSMLLVGITLRLAPLIDDLVSTEQVGKAESGNVKAGDPLKPGGVAIIAHPDKEANRERKLSLISNEPVLPQPEAEKAFVFDHPLVMTDFFHTIAALGIGGLIFLVIILIWVFVGNPKWRSKDKLWGAEHYQPKD